MTVLYATLKKRADFLRMNKRAAAVHAASFVLTYLWEDTPGVRVGFTATRKKVGGAVKRNRARRRLRALCDAFCRLNENFALPAGKEGLTLVFIARACTVDMPWEKLEADMAKALKELSCVY